jgi:hypothetical protein
MNQDHLVIHKEPSLNSGIMTHYLVNTYYDYTQTYYFVTLAEAKKFVSYQQETTE